MLAAIARSVLTTIGRELGRIVLHSSCVACGGDLPWKDRVASCCGSCWRALPELTTGKCRRCAIVLPVTAGSSGRFLCIDCTEGKQALEWIEAWGDYSGSLESVLSAFKFEHHSFLARPLGMLLVQTFNERGDFGFDCVTAVPMDRARLRRRGYNQSLLLARELSRMTAFPLRPKLLLKKRATAPQSSLARGARLENVRGVYAVNGGVRDQAILLVDDICTTGATLESCAAALLAAGAERVCAITVARASLR